MNKTMIEKSFVGILAKARDELSMDKLKSNRNITPQPSACTPKPPTRPQTARPNFLSNKIQGSKTMRSFGTEKRKDAYGRVEKAEDYVPK